MFQSHYAHRAAFERRSEWKRFVRLIYKEKIQGRTAEARFVLDSSHHIMIYCVDICENK